MKRLKTINEAIADNEAKDIIDGILKDAKTSALFTFEKGVWYYWKSQNSLGSAVETGVDKALRKIQGNDDKIKEWLIDHKFKAEKDSEDESKTRYSKNTFSLSEVIEFIEFTSTIWA